MAYLFVLLFSAIVRSVASRQSVISPVVLCKAKGITSPLYDPMQSEGSYLLFCHPEGSEGSSLMNEK